MTGWGESVRQVGGFDVGAARVVKVEHRESNYTAIVDHKRKSVVVFRGYYLNGCGYSNGCVVDGSPEWLLVMMFLAAAGHLDGLEVEACSSS